MWLRLFEQPGGEHERDVNHDEHQEPDEHEEVQRSCGLDAEHPADPLEPCRERRRHAEPCDERERCGDEDRDEVREELESVVGDPSVFGRPVQRQVLDQHRQRVGKYRPRGRHDATPLTGREQQDVEHETVEQPERSRFRGATNARGRSSAGSREAHLARQADRVLLRRPQRLSGNRLLNAEPVFAGRAVPRPIQPRMVAEDLQPRPDDEDQEEQIEEVLHSDPDRKSRIAFAPAVDGPGVAGNEALDRRNVAQTLRGRHGDDQEDESDRQQPEQVEPPAAADAHTAARCR